MTLQGGHDVDYGYCGPDSAPPSAGEVSINWLYQSGGLDVQTYTGIDGDCEPYNSSFDSSTPIGETGYYPSWENVDTTGSFNQPALNGHAIRAWNNQTETKLMIVPSGQQTTGGTTLYLALVSALQIPIPVNSSDGLGTVGSIPLAPGSLTLNGQTLINSGITNGDGSVSGAALISAPSGASVPLAVSAPVSAYSFNGQTPQVHLAIIDTNSGVDLTLQTNTVIVGQQMNWYAQLSNTNSYMTNFSATNFQWTVPGFAISNYVVAPDSSSATVVTNFATNNANVIFYWADGANKRVVQCSATVNGKTITSQAAFDVLTPTGGVSTVTGTMGVDTSWYGDLELAFGTPTTPGISFSPSISMPFGTNYNYGNTNYNIEWIQLINSNKSCTITTVGDVLHIASTTNVTLDTTYPYPFNQIATPPYTSTSTSDSPAPPSLSNTNYIAASITFSATMWLMFQPANGQWIPLRTVSWNCYGAATNLSTGWVLTSANWSTNPPDAAAGAFYPRWFNNVTNEDNIWNPPF